MTQKAQRKLRSLWYLDTMATEMWLSTVSCLGGLWLALPFETISVPFRAFAGYGVEPVMALWLISLGSFRFHAVFTDRHRRRAGAALASFSTWVLLLTVSLMVDARSLLVVLYAAMAMMSVWVFFRIPSKFTRRVKPGGVNATQ